MYSSLLQGAGKQVVMSQHTICNAANIVELWIVTVCIYYNSMYLFTNLCTKIGFCWSVLLLIVQCAAPAQI